MFSSTVDEDGESDELPTLKVTWKAKKSDETNGGYSEEVLQSILSQVRSIVVNFLCALLKLINHCTQTLS